MKKSLFSSAVIGFVMGCIAVCSRWGESLLEDTRRFGRHLERVIDVMGEFPASAKMRFEVTLAKWRMMLGSPDAISASGLVKSSHHFKQRGVKELVIDTHALA